MDALHAGLAMFLPSMVMAFMAPVAAKSAERLQPTGGHFFRHGSAFVGDMGTQPFFAYDHHYRLYHLAFPALCGVGAIDPYRQ